MAVYTRNGDDGSTRGLDGQLVPKDAPRPTALGELDELNAHLGLSLAACGEAEIGDHLRQIQAELFALGAVLAGAGLPAGRDLAADDIRRLEEWIDRAESKLPPIQRFVMPAGTELVARLHVARTVCRRAERAAVALSREADVPAEVLAYLNRLGDLLFVYARWANCCEGVDETTWP
jgi:cob(I)alamin adenosyltransferase